MNRSKSFFWLNLLLFTLFCHLNRPVFGQAPKRYVIIGYAYGKDLQSQNIEAEKLTHINYAFAVPTKTGELSKPSAADSANLAYLNTLRQKNKDLKILISIGGWGGCQYFSDVALNETARTKFARSIMAFVQQFNLDGVDIDWEYPAQVGAGNIFRPEDKQNYTLLLQSLRENLDAIAAQNKRPTTNKYLLTAAHGGDTTFVSHTELAKAQQYLDYINLMTYDLYHGNDKVTGHHSPLYQSAKGDQSRNSSAEAVEGHIRAGVPVSKLVLGLPFYGRGWTDIKNADQGLYQPSTGKHLFLSYDILMTSYIGKNGFTRYWDKEAKAPYLWNPKTRTFVSYADVESFTYKTDYVKKQQLAGVMFWEYSYDLKNKHLLNKLYQDLTK